MSRIHRGGRRSRHPLPSHPALLARVIRIAGDPDRSLKVLGSVCAQDPELTVELIRAANAAGTVGADPVRTVPAAVVKLGARAVRSLVIHHTMRAAESTLGTHHFNTRAFWEDSLRRAAAAELLADRLGLDEAHEAFAVGLTQDLGTLTLARDCPDAAPHLDKLRSRPGETRIEAEKLLTGRGHPGALLSSGLLRGLPSELRFAVAHHHSPPEGDSRGHQLARIAQAADRLADVVQAFPKARCIALAREALAPMGLDEELPVLIDLLAARVDVLGRELSLDMGEQPTMAQVSGEAAQALNRLPAEVTPVQTAPPPRRRRSYLPRRQRRDALTGLLGQRAFLDELAVRAAHRRTLSLLVLDLDHLARLNRAHGVATGDDALKLVAHHLQRVAGHADVTARLGGEEFALLLDQRDAASARRVAEHLRRALAAAAVPGPERPAHLTVSVGGATLCGPIEGEELLEEAERALHAAKRRGRDRVLWADEEPREAVDLPAYSGAA